MALFRAKTSTADGRLSIGKIYEGDFFWLETRRFGAGWRIRVKDNFGCLMTFNPKAFGPAPRMN